MDPLGWSAILARMAVQFLPVWIAIATVFAVSIALRNALIAPFTVIMLQIPWLLNGVVIVEVLFSYPGFGWTLVEAAGNNDIELLLACAVVAVVVVLVTQLISDVGYVWLNPRIRIS